MRNQYIDYWAQLINESEEDKPLNEMAVRKVDEIISNPKILERNWDEVLDILFNLSIMQKCLGLSQLNPRTSEELPFNQAMCIISNPSSDNQAALISIFDPSLFKSIL